MNSTVDFSKMTREEKLAYIEKQLAPQEEAKLCRIDEPDCESCQ